MPPYPLEIVKKERPITEINEEIFTKKPEKEVISIRIDTDLLKIIDIESGKVDISRNEFINQCIVYALENIESKNE